MGYCLENLYLWGKRENTISDRINFCIRKEVIESNELIKVAMQTICTLIVSNLKSTIGNIEFIVISMGIISDGTPVAKTLIFAVLATPSITTAI